MFWNIIIGLALMIIGYLIMPKPKGPKPDAAQEMEKPTADAGRPIAVLFGEKTIKGPNYLGYWDIANVRQSRKSKKK